MWWAETLTRLAPRGGARHPLPPWGRGKGPAPRSGVGRVRAAGSLLAALLLLAACGFEPVYGEARGTAVRGELQAVRVALIANRSGQQLRRYILDRIHGG